MRPLVLGTAGHIDHGKTALVRALTGTDTDRLPEEKRRGITIDLGFAHLQLPDGTPLSVIDVPGHEGFVRNMLAGATGIDMALLVIAADEGPMPQTLEHLAILRHLAIRAVVVALTRIDLVENDWLDLMRDEVRELLASEGLANAPIVDVSAHTGSGLPRLIEALARLAQGVAAHSDADLFRMPIDRVFTVRGTGTVATGTVWSGSLSRDAYVRVVPGDATARVRALQQHGLSCDVVQAGTRAAVALSGIDREALARGATLVTADSWRPSSVLTSAIRMDRTPLRPRQRVRVHIGTCEVLARVGLLREELPPGHRAIVQLRLEEPVLARAGDRLVLRSFSPVHTVGGGTVVEPDAPKRRRLEPAVRTALESIADHPGAGAVPTAMAPALIVAAVALAGTEGLPAGRLPILAGLTPETARRALSHCEAVAEVGGLLMDRAALQSTEERVREHVARFHRSHPIMDGVPREALRRDLRIPLLDAAVERLLADGTLVSAGNALADPAHRAAPDVEAASAMRRLAEVFDQAALAAPDLSELPADLASRSDLPRLLHFLERDGEILRLSGDRFVSVRAVSEGVLAVRAQLSPGQPLGIADFRQVMNLSRKHLIPLLEYFDRTGVTRRSGDSRLLAE